MSQLVKAYTEIVSVKIGSSIVSMTIAQKQNESGLKYNERLFILVHDSFVGYISKVKINESASSIDIDSAKVKIPIKNLFTFETDEEVLKIKFTYQEDGRIIPKQWIFKMGTVKLAELWKQLLQYEVKMKAKSGNQTKRSGQSTDKKSPRRDPTQKSLQKTPKAQNKKPQSPPQPKVISPPKEQTPVIQIKNPQATGSFDDSLFSDESQEDKKERNKRLKGKPQTDKKQSPRKPNQQQSKPSNNKNKPNLAPLQTENLVTQEPPPIKKQQNTNQRNANRQQNLSGSRFFKKQPEIDLPPIQQQVQSQHSVEVPSFKKPPVKVTQQPKREIKKSIKTKQQTEVDFMNNLLLELQQKNKKFPFSQITYNRQQMNDLINAYKDKMQVPINQSRTQVLLNRIMEHQKSKMMRNEKKTNKDKSWIYNQIVQEQSKCLFEFQQHCQKLMKSLSVQILKGQFFQFRKHKNQNNILYLSYQDVAIKVLGATNKQNKNETSNLKSMQIQKRFKNQFKFYRFLHRIIQNTGQIRVPLIALCQFGGLVVFFKAIPVYYENQNDNFLQKVNRRTDTLSSISGFPLKQMLKLKPLNEFFYSQMRSGETSVNFKYYFVDEVYGLSNIQKKILKASIIDQVQDFSPQLSLSKDELVGKPQKRIDLQIKKIVTCINNFDFYFIHPKELSKFFHSNNLNLLYLGQVYTQIQNQFISSCILAQIMSRISKNILKKKLQNIWIDQKNQSFTFDKIETVIKQQMVTFLNSLLGKNIENEVLWKQVIRTAEEYYSIKIENKNNVNKGQLLISLSYHLGFQIQWTSIDASKVFNNQQFFRHHSLINLLIKTKSYKPFKTKQILEIQQKLSTETHQNFSWLVDKLNLKQNPIPIYINIHSLDQTLKLYLTKYIEPQQLDWSVNFAHLSLYTTAQPTLITFQIDLQMIKWYLKKDNKFKYLNKFTQITKKIEHLYGNNHPSLSNLYEIFSQYHQSNNQIEDSIRFMKSSIVNFSALGGDNNQSMANKFYKMATLLIQFGRQAEGMDYLKKAKRIVEVAEGKKLLLYGQIKLQIAQCYYKSNKFTQTLVELQDGRQYLQIFQKEADSHQQQRLKFYQLIHLSCSKLNKTNQLISLSNSLEPKLKYFKNHTNFQEVLWIVIENNIKTLTPQNKQSVFKIINLIKTKQSINFYKKSYELLKKRYNQNILFSLFKTYCANSSKIIEMIVSNNILNGWDNLSKIHDRQSLFDFISMFQELIYLFGRENLNSIKS